MKTFDVYQLYASLAYVRRGERMIQPLSKGSYQANTIVDAVRQAAKEWNLPAILLSAAVQQREEVERNWEAEAQEATHVSDVEQRWYQCDEDEGGDIL